VNGSLANVCAVPDTIQRLACSSLCPFQSGFEMTPVVYAATRDKTEDECVSMWTDIPLRPFYSGDAEEA
jgi:hypothetical protein